MNDPYLNHSVVHKRHKYGARRTCCRLGHSHPSLLEAKHCWYLQNLMQATSGSGDPPVKELEYEKAYKLVVAGNLISVHKPDFTYKKRISELEKTGQKSFVSISKWIICVDEVKGFKTADWAVKSKLFQALYPDIEYKVIQ